MSGIPEPDASVLRGDLERLSELGAALVGPVYAHWATVDPAGYQLFAESGFGNAREMLDTTLVSVHDQLEGASWLAYNVAAYGARHEGAYFVGAGMYEGWIEAVLRGLREVLGPDFDDEHANAWRHVLARTCRAMSSYRKLSEVRAVLAGGAE